MTVIQQRDYVRIGKSGLTWEVLHLSPDGRRAMLTSGLSGRHQEVRVERLTLHHRPEGSTDMLLDEGDVDLRRLVVRTVGTLASLVFVLLVVVIPLIIVVNRAQ